MILTKLIRVRRSKYYKELGYDISEKFIEVKINDLPKGSHLFIEAKCDYCDNMKEISYKEFNSNIKINGKFSCSIKCGSLKSKETSLIKYGVESVNQLLSKKQKSKNTIKEKYGVDHISQLVDVRSTKSSKMKENIDNISSKLKKYWNSLDDNKIKIINEKRENTNLERYGVRNISQHFDTKEKVKNTTLEKWGGYTYQSEELLNKVISTNLEKYGHTFSSSSREIKEKIILRNIEKYGSKSPMQLNCIKEKVKNTILEKYGVENIMFSEKFREKFNISKEKSFIKYVGDKNYEFYCNTCKYNYIIDYDNFLKRKNRKCETCTICYPIGDSQSLQEKELGNYIQDIYKNEIIRSYRDRFEIDIYLPKLNIGFEFNGLYWHSENKLDKNYHINKSQYFESKGIRIYHIWEDDWIQKKDIIKSQIKSWIGISETKIWARKCEIKEVIDIDTYKKFLIDNHIQGYIRATIKLGLYCNNELVSLMTFDKAEGRKTMNDNEWNLSRFCNVLNTNVIGGASKLLKHFIKEYKSIRIISFADLDWSKGDLYYKLGFNLVNTLGPDYKYVSNNTRLNKQRFTKNKLQKLGYSKDKTESQITLEMGLYKIYNCGQLKFEMKLNK
jgi:hypothetical protein